MKKLICIIAMSLIYLCSVKGESEAQWITFPNFKHQPNQWFQIRKTFTLNQKSKDAVAKIAVDSKYWLWINEELVVREGMVKRGPNPEDTYYDEINLGKYLKKGENTIAVLAWYFGREGFSHKDSKQFGFLFDAKIGEEWLVSDSSWRIRKCDAYGDLVGGKAANWRLSEGNVQFNAQKETLGWYNANYDDQHWESAKEFGEEGCAPWNKLVKRPIPQWKDFGLKKVTKLARKGNQVTMSLPYNMQFNFWMKVKAAEGKTITVKSDNYDWLNDVPIRGQYVTKEGIQEYEHLPWMSGHAVIFECEEGVEILEAGYRETGYDTKLDGTFSINDQFLMRFLDKARNTLYINMRDTYFDCPDRERAQWWGDMVLLMEESFYLMDNNAIALSTKGIRELRDWQKSNGAFFAPIPAGNWDRELPHQMLAVIGVALKNYLLYTGDEETYLSMYPSVKKYMNLWTVDDKGHLKSKKREFWGWYDHGDKIDAELLEHGWYSIALDAYAEMAQMNGEVQEAKSAKEARERIKTFVNDNYWTSEGYRSINYKDEIDDRGNGLMVVADIADEGKYNTIASLLKRVRHSSPYIDKYQLDALFKMGKADQALERIKDRYSAMVNDKNITTLWEFFDLGNCSYNHGWSGAPLIMMYKKLAGINPVEAGFKEFEVFPDPLDYDDVCCSFSTVKGKISMEYGVKGNEHTLRLDVPGNSAAIIRIPVGSERWSIKGGKYDENCRPENEKYKYFKLSEGNWTIEYTKPVLSCS
ncbi:glycoside hydrolase [Puteibacter caeruleilacunae]|nr:glycoside hydrolase [Puteibacter caeruleilacunae]